MKIKKYLLPLLAALAVMLAGCGTATVPAADKNAAALDETAESVPEGIVPLDLDAGAAAPAQAVWTSETELSITAAGAYRLSGSLEGRITVDADGPVELILAGVTLTGPKCLEILSEDPVTVTAAEGTENALSDGAAESDGAAPWVITSKAPLTLDGAGSLTVTAGASGAIRCKDDLTVRGELLTVSAAGTGLKADGALTVEGGILRVYSGGDGMAADARRLADGTVLISGGTVELYAGDRGIDGETAVSLAGGDLTIVSGDDGIRGGSVEITDGGLSLTAGRDGVQAGTLLTVSGGTLSVTTGAGGGGAIDHPGESFGPWSQAAEDTGSAKGLKCDGDITLSGGVIDLNTEDDSVHCGGVFTQTGGDLTILSGDDGIHADDMLIIGGGTVTMTDCFEGLEAFAVEIRDGDVFIRSVNDGVNANGPEGMFGGSQEFQSVSGASTTYFLMSGGTLDLAVTGSMSNMGDGVDSNGAVYITGGEMVVSTYGTFMENGLDTGWGGPVVTGGAVIAGGSSTMAEGFSSGSTQCCAVVPTSYMPDGTEVVLTDEAGTVLWSVTLRDAFSCLQISHPAMTAGHVYTLSYGGETTALDFTAATNISSARGFGGPGRPW